MPSPLIMRRAGFVGSASAAATPLVLDTFTDDDDVTLPNHTPDIDSVGDGWVDFGAGALIDTNRAEAAGFGGGGKIDSGASDVVITANLTLHATDSTRNGRFYLRMQDDSNFWVAFIKTNQIVFYEVVAGVFTARGDDALSYSNAETVSVTITANGTTISVSLNDGEHEISYASASNFQTETVHGLAFERPTIFIDDYQVVAA